VHNRVGKLRRTNEVRKIDIGVEIQAQDDFR
jgi:hypothetical protein